MKPLELRDIHLPGDVSWWPPAIGWWIVLLAIVLLAIGIYFLVKMLKEVSVRKMALVEFNRIQSDYQSHQNKTELSQQLSQLLRQMLMSSFPRAEVAGLSGEQWLKRLNMAHPKSTFQAEWLDVLTTSTYQKQADYDAEALLSQLQPWINTYPKRYLL